MAEGAALTRKMGPLPVWAWGLLGGVAVYFLYTRYKSGQTGSTAGTGPVASVLDPNAVDPTTGLTYGQELGGSFPVSSPGFGGLGTTANDSGLPAPGADFVSGFDAGQAAFMDALSAWQDFTGAVGATPSDSSANTVATSATEPLKNTGKQARSHHRQRTMHVAHPGSHQHKVKSKNSKAHPVKLKHPAGGAHPGHVHSGGHQRATANRPTHNQPHRGGAVHRPPPPRRPPPRRRRRRR